MPRRLKVNRPVFTVWFTGLPCAGKTTLARMVADEVRRRGREVELLDGDVIRTNLSKGLGFTKEDRDENIRRMGFLCRLLCKHGVCVITAAVSPYRAVRDEVRASLSNFVEVYVKASVTTCVARDVKGLYKKALSGKITNFTGVDDPYEPPNAPEVLVETDNESPETSSTRILSKLEQLKLIPPARRASRQII